MKIRIHYFVFELFNFFFLQKEIGKQEDWRHRRTSGSIARHFDFFEALYAREKFDRFYILELEKELKSTGTS